MFRTPILGSLLLTFAAAGSALAATPRGGVDHDRPASAAVPQAKVQLSQQIVPELLNIINFDGAGAPSLFVSTTALASVGGVSFNGNSLQPTSGGAVLDQSSNFGVTGHSAPNFLAFNCGTSMADGGTPTLPETIHFPSEVSRVSLKVGSGIDVGDKVTFYGLGSQGAEKRTVALTAALSTVSFRKPVSAILVLGSACRFVIDDLTFQP